MRRLRRLGTVIIGALGLGYLLICASLFVLQRKMIFPAPGPLVIRDGTTRVDVPAGTFFTMREAGPGPVVVHFHGNGEQVAHLSWLGQSWARSGVTFIAVEYPGYSGAPGAPSETTIFDAADAALRHLTGAMGIDRSRIVLVGQSIGSGVAVAMASRGWGRRLVLLSPYTSLADVVANAFPYFPVRWLLRDPFDSLGRAGLVKIPTLVVHGTKDELIPFALGQALTASIGGAQLYAVKGGHHNDLWDSEATRLEIFQFVLQPTASR